MFSQELFCNPPDEYRGTDFWMLNDALDEDEIRLQIQEMKAQGIGSVIARTYIGLKSDYPGADFKRKMHCIIDTAKEVGIRIFLQAGYMPEAVLDLPQEFALRILKVMPEEDYDEEKGELLATHDGTAYVATNSLTFLDMLNKDAMDFYIKQSYENMWAEFAAEFGETCQSVWVDEPSYSASGLPWSPAIPEAFKAQWGYELAPKVPLLYRDIDDYETVRFHYWKTIQNLLEESYFKSVQDWCQAHNLQCSGHLMQEDTMRQQFSRAGATMPFYKYFDIPGIDCLMCEMDWRYAPLKRRYDSTDFRPNIYTTPLQCVSAAHQAGRAQILAEMYGVSSENLTFRDQKNMFDHFASIGINHRSVHGIFYSLRGRGKRAYPPHVNYYQPYWKDYRMLTDYCARASYFISQGTPVKDVVVIHPLSSAACELRGPGSPDGADSALTLRDQRFLDFELQLLSEQIAFELADEKTTAEWGKTIHTADGAVRLQIGQMDYATVVLPNLKVMTSGLLNVLTDFALAGGRVIVCGDIPYLLDGWPEPSLTQRLGFAEHIIDTEQCVRLLTTLPCAYQLETTSDRTSIIVNHRRDTESDYFFLFNQDCREARTMTLRIPGKKLAAILPEDGGIPCPVPCSDYDHGESAFSIAIPEGGSVMLMVRDAENIALPSPAQIPATTTECVLPQTWRLARLNDNCHYLEFASYRTENQDFGNVFPILAIQDILTQQDYHGMLTLRYTFTAETAISDVKLALEMPEGQTITLNGQEIANQPDGWFMARQFKTIPLGLPLAKGLNVLEITRYYEPLAKFRSAITSLFENLPGVELEPIYLVGDFAVYSRQKPTRAAAICLSHDFRLGTEITTAHSELTTCGYPFYAGTIALEQDFDMPDFDPARTATLELDGVCACHARVYLNGQLQGETAWEPYAVELTALKHGRNTLRLELTNTLKNMLGPHHRPKGEYGECWGGYKYPNLAWEGAEDEITRKIHDDWAQKRQDYTNAWTEDYMVVPFGLAEATIVIS